MQKSEETPKSLLANGGSTWERLVKKRDAMQNAIVDQLLDPAPFALAQMVERIRQYTETYSTVMSLEAGFEHREKEIEAAEAETGLDFAKAHAEIVARLTRLGNA